MMEIIGIIMITSGFMASGWRAIKGYWYFWIRNDNKMVNVDGN